MVERSTVNRLVVGSSPTWGDQKSIKKQKVKDFFLVFFRKVPFRKSFLSEGTLSF